VAITSDTKDWTWVLERACPDCGLDTPAVDPTRVADLVRDNAQAWRSVLADTPTVPSRPAPDVWSPLEYACHVRDVFTLFDERLGLMLHDDDPLFVNWDQDETAVVERYGEQDPVTVAAELELAAQVLAGSFAAVRGDRWGRPGRRGDRWGRPGRRSDGARFTVASFARYFIHDPVHHLWDVTGQRAPAV
jgi:hypothetical protein